MSTTPGPWVKARMSADQGSCVEMRRNGEAIQVRDSKLGDRSPILSFTRAEMLAWLDGARGGEFDHLAS